MPENQNADAEIEAMRRESWLRQQAGGRFLRTDGRWEDADGQIVDAFPDEMDWGLRRIADLGRWGLDTRHEVRTIGEWVDELVFGFTDQGTTIRVSRDIGRPSMLTAGGHFSISDPALLRKLADAFDVLARERGA